MAAAASTTTEKKAPRVVIIGGGPCGMGAAWRLEELKAMGHQGADWVLVEQSPEPGGLAASVVDPQGFTWDMGGHVIFSHYEYFSKLLDALVSEFLTHEREAWCWMRDRFIPYPLQNNIHRLPPADLSNCLDGLVDLERKKGSFSKPKNFLEWLEQGFGKGLNEVFMVPYNFKVWAYPPEQMNVEWMGERVATVDLKRVLSNLVNQRDELGWGPNATFRFPLHGGTGAIWTALANALPKERMLCNKKVVGLDAAAKVLSFADGTSMPFDYLISTMPLDILCRVTRNLSIPSEKLAEAADKFRHSASHIIGFGIEGTTPAELKTKCWLYFSENNCPFYRATVFSNYSPNHVPKPGQQWSLMCEVSESPLKPVDMKTIIAEAERGLLATKLISPESKIVSRWHTRLEYGYPTPFIGRDAIANPIHAALRERGILSRGRFGSWKYEISNQDHSLMLGVEAADNVMLGSEETTFWYPGVVNAKMDGVGREPFLAKQMIAKQKAAAAAPAK